MPRRSFGSLRKLKSGRYQAKYSGLDGLRHTAPITFSTKRDADTWLAERQAEMSRGIWQSPVQRSKDQVLFDEYFEKFINSRTNKGKPIKASTRELYRRLGRTKLSDFFGVPLSEISQQDIRDWHTRLVETGKITTTAHAYKLLKSVFNDALQMELIQSNPCRIKGAQAASTGKKVVSPTTSEVLAIARSIASRYRLAVLIAAFAGLRFGELTELRRKDVIFSTGNEGFQLRVERAVTYVGGEFVVGPPKSRASVRTIPITRELEVEFRKHLLSMEDKSDDALVFPGERGQHLRNDIFAKSFKRALKKAGARDGITPHSLRHHAASYFAKVGANLPELKEWLGDSSTVAATRYLHSTDRTRSLVDRMTLRLEESA